MKSPPLSLIYMGAIADLRHGALSLIAAVSGAGKDMPEDATNDVRLAISILDQCARLEKEAKG